MANMSYCRFQNTNIDLRDCLEALEDGSELSTDISIHAPARGATGE